MPPGRQSSPRFLADAMLGSLARKLRALGFETAYYREGDDTELLALALSEGRVVLTSDRSLAARAGAKGVRALLVEGSNDRARIRGIVRSARLAGVTLQRGDSLCSNCGGELQAISRASALGMVPPAVGRRHRLFFRCLKCGQIYWRGSHWKKLMSLARLLKEE
jgi:uncharacterized protein